MQSDLEKSLAETVDVIRTSVEMELPNYTQELCQYTIVSGVINLCGLGVLLAIICFVSIWCYRKFKSIKDQDVKTFVFSIMSVIILMILASICIDVFFYVNSIVKAKLSPRVLVVEKLLKN